MNNMKMGRYYCFASCLRLRHGSTQHYLCQSQEKERSQEWISGKEEEGGGKKDQHSCWFPQVALWPSLLPQPSLLHRRMKWATQLAGLRDELQAEPSLFLMGYHLCQQSCQKLASFKSTIVSLSQGITSLYVEGRSWQLCSCIMTSPPGFHLPGFSQETHLTTLDPLESPRTLELRPKDS